MEIAKTMEYVYPDAWLLNYSNPLTCLSIAVRETTDIKMLGLCHGICGTIKVLSGFLGTDPGKIDLIATGINHVTWLLDLRISGKDDYPKLREMLQSSDVPRDPSVQSSAEF